MFEVIRKYVPGKNKPWCEGEDLYSIDGGNTWMNGKEYRKWKRGVIRETWLKDPEDLKS